VVCGDGDAAKDAVEGVAVGATTAAVVGSGKGADAASAGLGGDFGVGAAGVSGAAANGSGSVRDELALIELLSNCAETTLALLSLLGERHNSTKITRLRCTSTTPTATAPPNFDNDLFDEGMLLFSGCGRAVKLGDCKRGGCWCVYSAQGCNCKI
jgi:hypothetical protein